MKLIRQTVQMTPENRDKVKSLSSHYGIRDYQMLDALIKNAKENDPVLLEYTKALYGTLKSARAKAQAVRNMVKGLTEEQLESLFKNDGAELKSLIEKNE